MKDLALRILQQKWGRTKADKERILVSKMGKPETSSGWEVSLKRGEEGPGRGIALYRKVSLEFEAVASGLVQQGWQRLGVRRLARASSGETGRGWSQPRGRSSFYGDFNFFYFLNIFN